MFKTEPQVSPIFEAVERATTDDTYLDVGQVMTLQRVHELRCQFQNRDPHSADWKETMSAVDELVAARWLARDEMFGTACVRRLV